MFLSNYLDNLNKFSTGLSFDSKLLSFPFKISFPFPIVTILQYLYFYLLICLVYPIKSGGTFNSYNYIIIPVILSIIAILVIYFGYEEHPMYTIHDIYEKNSQLLEVIFPSFTILTNSKLPAIGRNIRDLPKKINNVIKSFCSGNTIDNTHDIQILGSSFRVTLNRYRDDNVLTPEVYGFLNDNLNLFLQNNFTEPNINQTFLQKSYELLTYMFHKNIISIVSYREHQYHNDVDIYKIVNIFMAHERICIHYIGLYNSIPNRTDSVRKFIKLIECFKEIYKYFSLFTSNIKNEPIPENLDPTKLLNEASHEYLIDTYIKNYIIRNISVINHTTPMEAQAS